MESREGALPAVVELNVGGSYFTTSLETLQGVRFGTEAGAADSMLTAMFSGRMPTRCDADGRYFIDRDGRYFHHILNYLRDGKFPTALSVQERAEVEREATFYGLEALASYIRADLPVQESAAEATSAEDIGLTITEAASGSSSPRQRAVTASEASECVLNRCLEEWPDFTQYVQDVIHRVLEAGGVHTKESARPMGQPPPGVVLDESVICSLQANTLAAVQIELAHVDAHSKAWRWSDRKTGVNSVLRAKLTRCHLQRLGYSCQIVPVYDKKEISAIVLQVELPIPP